MPISLALVVANAWNTDWSRYREAKARVMRGEKVQAYGLIGNVGFAHLHREEFEALGRWVREEPRTEDQIVDALILMESGFSRSCGSSV